MSSDNAGNITLRIEITFNSVFNAIMPLNHVTTYDHGRIRAMNENTDNVISYRIDNVFSPRYITCNT